MCLLLSDSSCLQACDRKAGLELTPQQWLRTQEGSVAREAPSLFQTQETTQQHKGGQRLEFVEGPEPILKDTTHWLLCCFCE